MHPFSLQAASQVWRRLAALVVACSLFTGCYTTHRFPAAPIPVRLASSSGFKLMQHSGGASCTVRRAEIEFAALSGDTLHFSRARELGPPAGATACEALGAGFIVLSDHPELRAERPAVNSALSWASIIFVALPLALGAIVVLTCQLTACFT
jgi:hypothetical protein